jgi:hypothetical protein
LEILKRRVCALVDQIFEEANAGLRSPDRCFHPEEAAFLCEVTAWLMTCCSLSGPPSEAESARLLYHSYVRWKRDRGEAPLRQVDWATLVENIGTDIIRRAGDDYRGLRLLPAERSRMESVQNLEAEEALFGWIEGGPRLRR